LPRLLPVRILLRDYAARGLPRDQGLWQFIQRELAESKTSTGGNLGACRDSINEALEAPDGAILLLDGIDEVPEAQARRWPWGDAWEPGYCNTEETGIYRTSAVGAFPRGANWTRDFPKEGQGEAVQDLVGNVSEWCSTRWQEKYFLPLEADEWLDSYLEGDKLRVLRGGSWGHDRARARGAFRLWTRPDSRGDFGFQCCVATSSC
jgi:hypothetical protein